tara:strand:+ start:1041 stop:1892 length:852 start_codon:yes stop_codon:yes gene_type:complete
MEGWIKIHRNITKWEWYDDSKTVHLFFHLLLSANHKDGNWRGQEVKRGQFITGLHKLNAATGISVRSLRTCLDRLKSTKEVTIKTTTKNSLITIVNYDFYQGSDISDKPNDKQTTIRRQSNDNQTTTNKNDNNDNNEKNEKNKEDIGFLISLYPDTCEGRKCSTRKGGDSIKAKLKKILSKKSKEYVEASIKGYVTECQRSKTYLLNFSKFLDELPEPNKKSSLLDDICKELKTTVSEIERKAGKTKEEIERHISFLMDGQYKQSSRTYESVYTEQINYYHGK